MVRVAILASGRGSNAKSLIDYFSKDSEIEVVAVGSNRKASGVLGLASEASIEAFHFTKDQMIDFCIMCGTDYNNNIPKIGNAGAFKLIEKYKNIDNIPDLANIELLNHKVVRNLFTNFDECIIPDIGYCKKPNYDELTKIFSINNIDYPVFKIEKKFNSKIIF